MIIANPIYDVVFKRLMENERVAKFFVGTMLGREIESLELRPQEFTYTDKLAGLAVFRLDFVAIVKSEDGSTHKVLIEIQKARNQIDLMRFRNYLAEQYKKEDLVEGEKHALPITTIYILGFTLRGVDTACLRVERQYRDLVNGAVMNTRNDFVEKLTHDSYIIQVKQIKSRYRSSLDKLLSIFEQANFIDDTQVVKEFLHEVDDENIATMTDILHHSGTDPESREAIEIEREAWRSVDAMFQEKERKFQKKLEESYQEIEQKDKELEDKDKELEDKDKELEDKDKELEDKDKELKDKDKELENQRRLIEELKNRLGE